VVPRAATGETKRPVTCTVVPGKAPAGCPEYANVPLAATSIGGSVTEPEHLVRSVKLRIRRPVPEIRRVPSEKM
jgi:predicted NAD/FAD-binding protein